GIQIDPGVVPGALPDLVLVVDVCPLLAAVVAAVEAPLLLRFEEGKDPIGPGGGDRHADLAQQLVREPFGALLARALLARQLFPGLAAVGRFPETASRTAADQFPRVAQTLPEARVQDAGVVRIH